MFSEVNFYLLFKYDKGWLKLRGFLWLEEL